jgi:hypothetical protein
MLELYVIGDVNRNRSYGFKKMEENCVPTIKLILQLCFIFVFPTTTI